MNPSIENLRKAAARSDDPDHLRVLADHAAFFIAGLRAAAEAAGRPIGSRGRIEDLFDDAREARDLIEERIRLIEGRSPRE